MICFTSPLTLTIQSLIYAPNIPIAIPFPSYLILSCKLF
jgi:hypothetical protein